MGTGLECEHGGRNQGTVKIECWGCRKQAIWLQSMLLDDVCFESKMQSALKYVVVAPKLSARLTSAAASAGEPLITLIPSTIDGMTSRRTRRAGLALHFANRGRSHACHRRARLQYPGSLAVAATPPSARRAARDGCTASPMASDALAELDHRPEYSTRVPWGTNAIIKLPGAMLTRFTAAEAFASLPRSRNRASTLSLLRSMPRHPQP